MPRKKKHKILVLLVSAAACVVLLFSCLRSPEPQDGPGRLLALEGHYFPFRRWPSRLTAPP